MLITEKLLKQSFRDRWQVHRTSSGFRDLLSMRMISCKYIAGHVRLDPFFLDAHSGAGKTLDFICAAYPDQISAMWGRFQSGSQHHAEAKAAKVESAAAMESQALPGHRRAVAQ